MTTQPQPANEDFTSIVLTIDHLAATAHEGGHQVHKFVCSTQSLVESMIALFDYYGQSALLKQASTIELFAAASNRLGLPIFVYHTAENTQVVCDADTWAVLINGIGKGSMLAATEALIDMVGKQLHDQIQTKGAASTLSLLMLSSEDPDPASAEEERPELEPAE